MNINYKCNGVCKVKFMLKMIKNFGIEILRKFFVVLDINSTSQTRINAYNPGKGFSNL